MAMLISLSHRDEREITVLPPNPIWAFGVNRKTRLDLFHSEAVEHRSHAGRKQALVGLEEMRVGHRRDEVADDPKVAASGFVIRELVTRQQTLKGHHGEMRFTAEGTGTHLHYEISFASKLPGVDVIVAQGLKKNVAKGLAGLGPKIG